MNTNVFSVKNHGDVKYLRYRKLEDLGFINHAISTRYGGVSQSKGLETMNLGTQTSDSIENVLQNYRIFCEAAGFTPEKLVLTKQTHSTNVRIATYDDCGKGYCLERDYDNVDALVTNQKGVPIVVHSADCIPVGFVDTKQKVIGVAHCGWRGTYGRLAQKTLEVMKTNFSSNPEDIICTVGPGICGDCYEVSSDLYFDFESVFGESEALFKQDNEYHIDLISVNVQILCECGVRKENIIISDVCTCCNKDVLYSHRGQGPERGIFATVFELV